MAYRQLPIVEVDVADLRLDLENYRIPIRPDDEASALKYLFASEDVVGQVKLFLRDGYFDNEVPIVVKERRHHVVLEGNRRVSALKAISDPALVPEHEHEVRELLTRYAHEVANMPTRIRVLVSPSRDFARPHVARLHSGLSKRAWRRDQQANFYQSLLGPHVTVDDVRVMFPGVDVVRYLRMAAMRKFLTGVKFGDASLKEYVRSSDLTMSAFEYAYRNQRIAASMGVAFDGARISPVRSKPERIGASISRQQRGAVEYLMSGFRAGDFNTRSPQFRKDSPAQEELLNILLGREATPPETFEGEEPTSGEVGEDDGSDEFTETPPDDSETRDESDSHGTSRRGEPVGRGPNHPDTRKGLSIAGFQFDSVPANLEKRYQELRKISVTDTPAAAAMLLRSVLEATVKYHFSGTDKAVSGELSKVMPNVVSEYGGTRALKDVLRTISSGAVEKPGSVKWFNAAAHNPDFPVTDTDVRQAFGLVESVLRHLLRPYSLQST